MTPDHLMVLAITLLVGFVLVRWGAVLLIVFALARFWVGEWGEALLALLILIMVEHAKAWASWIDWNAGGRDAWLRQRNRTPSR